MPFNIPSININYKKYTPIQAPNFVEYSNDLFTFPITSTFPTINHEVVGVPTWLTVYNVLYNEGTNKMQFFVKVNETAALWLQEGVYTATLKMRFSHYTTYGYPATTGYLNVTAAVGLAVSITVENTILLQVNPNNFVFPWIIGSALPQNQSMQIVTESNWSAIASQSWVTITQTQGTQSGQTFIGVDPTGLPVGNYEGLVTVNDNLFTENTLVTLQVTEGDTETSYLYVNPINIQFISEFQIISLQQIPLNLETSHNWTATTTETWLVLSATSGAAGITTINAHVVSENLAVNNYTAEIHLTCDGITKTVYVLLNVIEFYIQGITNETLYFAEDRPKVQATATENNTFLAVSHVSSNGEDNLIYTKEAPFFNGLASVLIGDETEFLLKKVPPTTNLISQIINNISPININLTAYKKHTFTGNESTLPSYTGLKFLNGKTPTTASKLSYIPDVVYVSNSGFISISAVLPDGPENIIITGDVNTTITASIANDLYVYNAIINISELNLLPGQSINIEFGTITCKAYIINQPINNTLIAFNNEWNEYEFFNTTGFITVTDTSKQKLTELQVEDYKQTKVVTIDYGKEYIINTGWVYTPEEVNWLANILKAKNIYLYLDGEQIPVILTTKKLEVFKTRDNLQSYNLKFKKALV